MFKKPLLIASSVLLAVAIAFMAFIPVFATENFAPEGIEINQALKETDRNYYYVSVFQEVINCFPQVVIPDGYGEKTIVMYPEEYAGAYIDESNNLHIVLTKNVDMETEYNYRKITSYDEDIIFDIAEFPLSYLYELQNYLGIVMQEGQQEFSIEAVALNEITNKLDIHIFNRNQEKDIIEFLKTNFDRFSDRCIVFKDSNGIKTTASDTTSNALAGSKTSYGILIVHEATLGFNAYRPSDGTYGVVTAAHYASMGQSIKNAKGTTIGSVSLWQYSGTIDAAYVPFSSSISQSYRLCNPSASSYDDCITGYCQNSQFVQIISGMITTKYGFKTGITNGYLINPSVVVNCSGVILTDQAKWSNAQINGDSGGPVVLAMTGPLMPNQVRPITLLGISCSSDNTGCYGSKVENIMNTFGIVPYVY